MKLTFNLTLLYATDFTAELTPSKIRSRSVPCALEAPVILTKTRSHQTELHGITVALKLCNCD